MPNNPAQRQAGSTSVVAGNKLVRGAALDTKIAAAATAVTSEVAAASTVAATTPSTSDFPIGGIIMWAGALADIPAGWNLCDGTNGTPDLRQKFIKGTAAGVDPGGTGGSATHTPAGTVAAPTFTGNSGTTSSVSAGTPAGTIDNHDTTVQVGPAGSAPLLTGPITHTFTGTALAGHTHTLTPTGTNSAPAFTGTSANYEPAYYALAFIQKAA